MLPTRVVNSLIAARCFPGEELVKANTGANWKFSMRYAEEIGVLSVYSHWDVDVQNKS